jgi:hypothetical protein
MIWSSEAAMGVAMRPKRRVRAARTRGQNLLVVDIERDSDAEEERSLHCRVTDWFLPMVDIVRDTVMLKKKGVYTIELLIDFFLW